MTTRQNQGQPGQRQSTQGNPRQGSQQQQAQPRQGGQQQQQGKNRQEGKKSH